MALLYVHYCQTQSHLLAVYPETDIPNEMLTLDSTDKMINYKKDDMAALRQYGITLN